MLRSRLISAAMFALTVGALVQTLPVTLAAPVPKHLMPKEEPFCYPTRVGDRHVSVLGTRTLVTVVTRVEKTPEGLLVESEFEADDGARTPNEIALVSALGVKVIEYTGRKLDTPFWWVKLPHAENNTWTEEWGPQTLTSKTTGWEEVEVPAGKLRAIRVEREDGPGRTTTYWWSPGVGCIKWTNGHMMREMTEFKAGK